MKLDKALQMLNEAIDLKKKAKSVNQYLNGDILNDIALAYFYIYFYYAISIKKVSKKMFFF